MILLQRYLELIPCFEWGQTYFYRNGKFIIILDFFLQKLISLSSFPISHCFLYPNAPIPKAQKIVINEEVLIPSPSKIYSYIVK